jgi:hypothetical protein
MLKTDRHVRHTIGRPINHISGYRFGRFVSKYVLLRLRAQGFGFWHERLSTCFRGSAWSGKGLKSR